MLLIYRHHYHRQQNQWGFLILMSPILIRKILAHYKIITVIKVLRGGYKDVIFWLNKRVNTSLSSSK